MVDYSIYAGLWQNLKHQPQFRDLLFADDCALVAHTTDDMQEMVNYFANAAASFGLQINIKKTEYMFQPAPGTASIAKDIFINGEPLKKVSSFSYLGSVISDDCAVDKDIAKRLQKASRAYGALQSRLWSQRGIQVKTKVKVYKAVVLTTLLYGSQSWTLYNVYPDKPKCPYISWWLECSINDSGAMYMAVPAAVALHKNT